MEFLLVLICHIIGFYIIQPNWLFENKYKGLFILFLSNGLYGLTVFLGFPVLLGTSYFLLGDNYHEFFSICSIQELNWPVQLLFYFILSHFIIDKLSDIIESYFRKMYLRSDNEMWKSFEQYAIGIENFLHIVNIYLVSYIYL